MASRLRALSFRSRGWGFPVSRHGPRQAVLAYALIQGLIGVSLNYFPFIGGTGGLSRQPWLDGLLASCDATGAAFGDPTVPLLLTGAKSRLSRRLALTILMTLQDKFLAVLAGRGLGGQGAR